MSNDKNKNNLKHNKIQEDDKSSAYFNALSPMAIFFQLPISMIVPIMMCLFFGRWLDKVFHRDYLFTIIFIVIGIGASLRTLYIMIMKFSNNIGKNNDKNH